MKAIAYYAGVILILWLAGCAQKVQAPVVIDERDQEEGVAQVLKIDSVWAGHPVGFCLLTHGQRQYIAYYNANRNMVVGQRKLQDDRFDLHIMPATYRETNDGTSTVLGWDSHNALTMAIDREGFIHLSGNMHAHPITYFRSTDPWDISTLVQHKKMVGSEEDRCTYPKFVTSKEGELIFHYRDGGSGNGNEIYNIYSCQTQKWSRLLATPLTDGQGLMNAYQSQPTVMADGWYHVYWVWRDTPDCSTNHDLSYMKSPDLKNWYNAFGEPLNLPATLDQKVVIVDPVPPKGGLLNLAAKLVLDENQRPVFVYHKYDPEGHIQLYAAQTENGKWLSHPITHWDYRWEFSGRGSINRELILKYFKGRSDGYYEVGYWHSQYGEGVLLLNNQLKPHGKVLKPKSFQAQLQPEGNFPGLLIQQSADIGQSPDPGLRYVLKWETLARNRDRPHPKPWPEPSQLYLYKLKKEG